MDERIDPEPEARQFHDTSLQRYAIDFGDWLTRRSLAVAHQRGHPGLRPAHARLLGFIAWEGSRMTDIAHAQDVSKNAIGQLVGELERLGYLERVPDPSDGRARLVRYTDRGHDLLRDAAEIGAEIDASLASVVGEKRLGELRSTLAELSLHLGLGPPDAPGA